MARNYTSAAWLSAFLTMLFWVPGCVAVAVNLVEAYKVKKRTGVSPQGYGCLWAVAIYCTLPIIAGVLFFVLLLLGGVAAGMKGA